MKTIKHPIVLWAAVNEPTVLPPEEQKRRFKMAEKLFSEDKRLNEMPHGAYGVKTPLGIISPGTTITIMNLLVVLIVLMLLFGGGGFYLGGPMVGGGGFGLILLILLVLFFTGGLSRR